MSGYDRDKLARQLADEFSDSEIGREYLTAEHWGKYLSTNPEVAEVLWHVHNTPGYQLPDKSKMYPTLADVGRVLP
jgi:hypothetical protein